MTYYSGADVAYVFVDSTNIAADLDTVRMKTSAVTQEFRALGTTFPQNLDTGTRNGELEMSGLYEGATTAALLNAVGTNRKVCVLLEGNTVSKRFYGFQSAAVESDEIGIGADQMHSNAGTFRVNGEIGRAS